jgi:ribose/xylose/arabinose/galactoside ABC-type transport system permease subunit
VGGILLAAVFYDSLQSGLTIIDVPTYWIQLPQGMVLLGAVLLDELRRRLSRRRNRPSPEPEPEPAAAAS